MNLLSRITIATLSPILLAGWYGHSVNYRQVYVGFNGPEGTIGSSIFRSREEAMASWIAGADIPRLGQLIESIDFQQQLLLAVAIGQRSTTTRNISIAEMNLYEGSLTPYVRIGVTEDRTSCTSESNPEKLYPFVLVVVDEASSVKVAGYDFQNFPDQCLVSSRKGLGAAEQHAAADVST